MYRLGTRAVTTTRCVLLTGTRRVLDSDCVRALDESMLGYRSERVEVVVYRDTLGLVLVWGGELEP